MQLGVLRSTAGKLPINRQSFPVSSESNAGVGVDRSIVAILGFDRQQFPRLGECCGKLVALDQHAGVFESRRVIVGRRQQQALQQKLGIVENIQPDADPRQ
jgi:hypothetical protein